MYFSQLAWPISILLVSSFPPMILRCKENNVWRISIKNAAEACTLHLFICVTEMNNKVTWMYSAIESPYPDRPMDQPEFGIISYCLHHRFGRRWVKRWYWVDHTASKWYWSQIGGLSLSEMQLNNITGKVIRESITTFWKADSEHWLLLVDLPGCRPLYGYTDLLQWDGDRPA